MEQEIKSMQQKINSVKSVHFWGGMQPGESRKADVMASIGKAGQEEASDEASAEKLGDGGQCK